MSVANSIALAPELQTLAGPPKLFNAIQFKMLDAIGRSHEQFYETYQASVQLSQWAGDLLANHDLTPEQLEVTERVYEAAVAFTRAW